MGTPRGLRDDVGLECLALSPGYTRIAVALDAFRRQIDALRASQSPGYTRIAVALDRRVALGLLRPGAEPGAPP